MTSRDRLLKHLRDLAGLSQGQLQRASHVDTHYICIAEKHGDHLYAPQAKRLCEALGWKGDPAALCKFVDEVDDVEGNIDLEKLNELREKGESGKLGRRRSKRGCRDCAAGGGAAERGDVNGAAGVLAAEGAL